MFQQLSFCVNGAQIGVLIQLDSVKTADTQPYIVCLLVASGRDQGITLMVTLLVAAKVAACTDVFDSGDI